MNSCKNLQKSCPPLPVSSFFSLFLSSVTWNLYANKWPRKKYLFMLFFFMFEEFMANSQSLSADVTRLVKNCLEQTAIPAAVPYVWQLALIAVWSSVTSKHKVSYCLDVIRFNSECCALSNDFYVTWFTALIFFSLVYTIVWLNSNHIIRFFSPIHSLYV